MFRIRTKSICKESDENLLRGIANGNEQFFKEIYKRYNKRLLYYFYRMLGNDEHLAKDFLQELFYKILDKPQLYDPSKKFSTWLFSVAHNMCKNEYRNRNTRKTVLNDQLDSISAAVDCQEQADDIKIKQIYTELDKLDETYRTAFLLKYREGLDIKEISDVLNLPTGTVKSRLFYARKKIHERICEQNNSMFHSINTDSNERFR